MLSMTSVGKVDKILSKFQGLVDDLKKAHAAHDAEAESVAAQISGLQSQHAVHRAESQRAKAVAAKIEALIS